MGRVPDKSNMARQATDTIPLKPETKELIKEQKKDGKTYDLWVRELMGVDR